MTQGHPHPEMGQIKNILLLVLANLTCIANLDLDFNHILSIQSKPICHVTGNYKMKIIGWWLDIDYLSFMHSSSL